MKTEKWYQRRLAKHFTEHYEQYEDTAEFFEDPAPNQWLFDIPELGMRVELTCDRKGAIHAETYELNIDRLYLLLKRQCEGFDAVYEDHIINVIGVNGFNILREKKFLTTCGSINGRTLYTLD